MGPSRQTEEAQAAEAQAAEAQAEQARLLCGGAEEFGRFYLCNEDAVLAFFLRRTRSAELAADLAAETFARALQGRGSFDASRGDPRAWLFGIAKHLLSDSVDRGRVQDSARRRLGLERLAIDDEAIARIDELTGGEASRALDELPAEQRVAIEGRVLDEQSYDELATRLRCSNSVVRQRVSRGLRMMRDRLEGLA